MTPKQREFKEQLEQGGFQIVRHVHRMWFEVIDPHGCEAVVVKQNDHAYHWFDKKHRATASNSSAARCHLGGLGDAIGTDGEMWGYKNLVKNAPEELSRNYEGLYVAIQQVM